ncbi:MAG: SnoaL-like polyketide cyclase [Solirubrobacteraceae bacterium]|jgi:ketosteroid isomerase-like protein|nr:SnoaL-like polyketide cyclase [Solirubrobacteraceae bacterium]
MSEENVAAVRRAYEVGYAERSVENLLDGLDESFVWHQRPEWPGRSLYGVEDLPQLWADLDDTYTEFSLVPEDFAPVGEYVVVTVRNSARMRASDARIEATLYHVWHLRDGKAREAWTYSTRAEALEAVGRAE